MKRKKSAFKESLLSVPYGRRHVQTGATPCQTVTSLCLMLTSQHAALQCVALFLTNILHLKPYVKKSQSQNCQESLVLLQFYSILQ